MSKFENYKKYLLELKEIKVLDGYVDIDYIGSIYQLVYKCRYF